MQNYELGEKIGHGGMGLVYKARDLGLDRDVAIKFMDEALLDDATCVERFLREARLLAKIDHPNVVRVLGAGKDEKGRPYFVMELLKGISLSERIRQGSLPEAEAVEIACQALGALGEAHSHGIVHRDIKSSNILLCPGGKVKLIDFGIARDELISGVTHTGKIIGTPAYMSPEQAMGEKAGPTSDLYSLGIVIYEMLVGKVPFRAETPVAILRMHTDHPPPALPGFVSSKLRSTVAWTLEKRPERRFKSAAAMLNELRATAGQAKSTPPKVATPKPDKPKAIPDQSSKTESEMKARPLRWLIPSLIVFFVVGGVSLAWINGAFAGQAGEIKKTEPDPINNDPWPVISKEFEEVAIAQETVTKNSASLIKGRRQTQTEGHPGRVRIEYEVTTLPGKPPIKKEVGRSTIIAPQDRVVLVGTKTAAEVVKKTNCPRCGAKKPNKFCGNCGWPNPDSRSGLYDHATTTGGD